MGGNGDDAGVGSGYASAYAPGGPFDSGDATFSPSATIGGVSYIGDEAVMGLFAAPSAGFVTVSAGTGGAAGAQNLTLLNLRILQAIAALGAVSAAAGGSFALEAGVVGFTGLALAGGGVGIVIGAAVMVAAAAAANSGGGSGLSGPAAP